MSFGCVFTNTYNTLPLEIRELIFFLMISKSVIKCEDCDNKESLIVACQLLKY